MKQSQHYSENAENWPSLPSGLRMNLPAIGTSTWKRRGGLWRKNRTG
jgi:hypothetical protein